jgi:type VI secretion system secreted protein VgrG
MPGKITILLQNFPALDDGATLQCVWGGAIQFVSAAQANHQIDDQAGAAGGGMAGTVFAPGRGNPPPPPASAPTPAASAPPPPAASTRSTLAAPATPQQAPARVDLSPMQSDYNQLWGQSFPNGQSQEHGGTIVADPSGKLSLINTGGGQSGSFGPNLATGPNQSVVGIFHTHPYDATEGGYTGVSLSGGDAAYMINQKQDVIVAQSGTDQFMYMRTQASPASVNAVALNNAQNARIGVLQGQGMGFSDASRQAARETATQYNLAYYEGSNGILDRVVP